MNNQIPYGYMPNTMGGYPNQGNCQDNEFKYLNERINNLEKQVRKLERRVNNLENNNMYVKPVPLSSSYNTEASNNSGNNFPNNYMI